MKRTLFAFLLALLPLTACGSRGSTSPTGAIDSTSVTFLISFKADNALRLDLLPLKEQSFAVSASLDSSAREHQLTLKLQEADDAFAALITTIDSSILTARIPYGHYRLGQVHEFTLQPVAPKVMKGPLGELLEQRKLEIPHGQYSGITHVEGDRYAVVHDKKATLFYFTLHFLPDGRLSYVSSFETEPAGAQARDPEDIVYIPEDQSFYICDEASQSIRECYLTGKESGRELSIPDDLKASRPNAGFEALAYTDSTLWTTTEFPLPAEFLPRMHRFQTFSLGTRTPAARFLYQADAPSVSETDRDRATAYVHGISAMTALTDGRIVVLEREVYVPGGSLFEKLGAFTESKLYSVSPKDDPAGILQKTLIAPVFRTNAFNLANYEGMCTGPVLQDGRQTLLLIADSQDGAEGLTSEYLQVIVLP